MSGTLLIICGYHSFSFAQEMQPRATSFEGVHTMQVFAEDTQDTMELTIGLPLGFDESRAYPVLFTLDANVSFGMVNDVSRLLFFETNYPVIVVGVGYSDLRKWMTYRLRDLTPTDGNMANINKYYKAVTKDVLSAVQKNYNVNTDELILYGHSSAALFGLYCLFQTDSPFSSYILTSPSLHEVDDTLAKMESQHHLEDRGLRANVYISFGDAEGAELLSLGEKFCQTMMSRTSYDLHMHHEVVEGSHMPAMPAGFLTGYQYIVGLLR